MNEKVIRGKFLQISFFVHVALHSFLFNENCILGETSSFSSWDKFSVLLHSREIKTMQMNDSNIHKLHKAFFPSLLSYFSFLSIFFSTEIVLLYFFYPRGTCYSISATSLMSQVYLNRGKRKFSVAGITFDHKITRDAH